MSEPDLNQTLEQYHAQGQSYFQQIELRQAIEIYTRGIKLAPDHGIYYFQRALAYYTIGKWQEALNDLVKCGELNVRLSEAVFWLAMVLKGMKKWEQALPGFNEALIHWPNESYYWFERGLCYFEQRRYREALSDFEQASSSTTDGIFKNLVNICQEEIEKDSTAKTQVEAEENMALGNYHAHLNDYKEAIHYYMRAFNQDPMNLTALHGVALAYFASGNNQRAIDCYTHLLLFDNVDFTAISNRSSSYFNIGEYQKAMNDAKLAVQINPDLSFGYLNRGNAYGALDQPDLAIADYNVAIELKPDLWHIYNNRGVELIKKGEFTKAITDFNKAIELDGHNSRPYVKRGVCFRQAKRFKEAYEDFSKALELDPNNQEAYVEQANNFLQSNQFQEALTSINQAIELDPDDALSFFLRAGIYINLRRASEGLADYKKVVTMDPENILYQKTLNLVENALKPKSGS